MCNFAFFATWQTLITSLLWLCVSRVIQNLPDYLAPIFAILWYFLVLRKYHNFNAALNRKQPFLAQLAIFAKLLLCFLNSFTWIFVRLSIKAVTWYPNYLIVSDCVHLFGWVRPRFVLNLPHIELLFLSCPAFALQLPPVPMN